MAINPFGIPIADLDLAVESVHHFETKLELLFSARLLTAGSSCCNANRGRLKPYRFYKYYELYYNFHNYSFHKYN